MKKSVLLILLFSGALSKLAAQDTSYLSANLTAVSADKASYYKIRQKTDSGWNVKNYFISGKIQMNATYADDSCHILQGEIGWYNDNGTPTRICNYKQGKIDGKETYFYDNGQVKITGTEHESNYEGDWIGYYRSGKLAAQAVYKKGKQLSATFYHEDGSADNQTTDFIRESTYPGGPDQFLHFLNTTMRYPDAALKKNIQGTVILQFIVKKDGTIANLKVVQSVDKLLDDEALRVLRKMKNWEPALMGGMPSDSYKKQPIVFRM
jgi:TonB family protein